LICFVVWIVWRSVKRSKARRNDGVIPDYPRQKPRLVLLNRILAKVPFLRNRQRAWQNLDGTNVAENRPPSYKSDKAAERPYAEPLQDFYAQEKTYQLPSRKQSVDQTTATMQLPKLDTTQPNPMNITFSVNTMTLNTTGSPFTHQPGQSFSSTNAAQFGASPVDTDTLRSRMPDPFFNQSELARGPSDAYDPARRQVNRVSELSSISSGFGDGDIVMPSGMSGIHPPPPAIMTNLRQSGRFSWANRSGRESVYTQASEDLPPRFRTLSSWVDQQTGRVKRAQQREDAPPVPALAGQLGVPGVHNPPVEQSFGMMMGDDEVPRRVEDTMALNR
jgi:hypothetical protein